MAKRFSFKIHALFDDIRTVLKSTARIPDAGHLNTTKCYSAGLSRDPARLLQAELLHLRPKEQPEECFRC